MSNIKRVNFGKGETVNNDELMTQKYPKEVVDSYQKMIEAQNEFENDCKYFSPKPPFKNGEKIFLDRYSEGDFREVIISYIKYTPYSNAKTLGAWKVVVTPVKKDFTKLNRHGINTISLESHMTIKRVIK